MKFNEKYPTPSKIFSERYELSYVLHEGTEKLLIPKILALDENIKITDEILSNTYFDQILKYQPDYSYIIRFRQRATYTNNDISFPNKFRVYGAGSIEIKKKNLQHKDNETIKKGTFFPTDKNKNIRSLLESTTDTTKLLNFVKKANAAQKVTTPSDNLHLISAQEFSEIASDLHLFAARLCIRQTFELPSYANSKITIETKPTFYAFPIMRKAHGLQGKISFPDGHLTEQPKRIKIEIKATHEDIAKNLLTHLSGIIESSSILKNSYSQEPFYKMIVRISKQQNTLINEAQGHEIEAKANISNSIDIESKIIEIQHRLLSTKNKSYLLFPTEHNIGMRGYAEHNRTIYGWKDSKSKWHEIATIIRMTEKDAKKLGFKAILKWKKDPYSLHVVMKRKTSLEYLENIPDETIFLKRLNKSIDKNVLAVGTCKKTKYRVYVQDKTGRNFCVSLDNIYVSEQKQLQQLEVEYVHTVSLELEPPEKPLKEACEQCIEYFIQMLRDFGMEVKQTSERKIEFLARCR